MRKILIARAVLLSAFLIWAALYLPVYFRAGEIVAPLSACQIPLLPVFFGVNFGYVLYAAFVVSSIVFCVMSFFSRFSRRVWAILPASLICILDVFGQVIRYRAASFEQYEERRLEAYYYFNQITPSPPWYFLIALSLDLLFLIFLLLPVFVKQEQVKEAAAPRGITTDVWSEIFENRDAPQDFGADMGEEYKPECEKK